MKLFKERKDQSCCSAKEEKKYCDDRDCLCEIKVLGGGCKKCDLLVQNAKQAVEELEEDTCVQKITNLQEIAEWGVMMTPALVIKESVVSSGRVPTVEEIKEMIIREKD